MLPAKARPKCPTCAGFVTSVLVPVVTHEVENCKDELSFTDVSIIRVKMLFKHKLHASKCDKKQKERLSLVSVCAEPSGRVTGYI